MREVKLYLGDCLDVMKDIPDHSVDMVLCDLPYGTTACSWDVIIPFEPLWEQYHRVCKESAVITLFGSQPFTSFLVTSNIKEFREELIWLKNKPASGFSHKQKHLKIHEEICVFSRVNNYIYNPQKWLVDKKEFMTQRKTFKDNEYVGNNIYGGMTRTRKKDDGNRNPISILSCRVPFTPQRGAQYSNDIDLRSHPTQKPVEMCEYLIKTYSNVGDTVLDNCMGSGTTGVACINTDRNFIGIEKEQKYFDISQRRIKEAEGAYNLWK